MERMACLSLTVVFLASTLTAVLGNTSCYLCGNVQSTSECVYNTTCNSDEVCYSSTNVIGGLALHSFGCSSGVRCELLMRQIFADMRLCYGYDLTDPHNPGWVKDHCGDAVQKKREEAGIVNVCYACCNDDDCNYDTCMKMKERLYLGYQNGSFDLHTMKNTTLMG